MVGAACLAEDGGEQQHAQAARERLAHAREAPLLQHRQHERARADGRKDAAPLRDLQAPCTGNSHMLTHPPLFSLITSWTQALCACSFLDAKVCTQNLR